MNILCNVFVIYKSLSFYLCIYSIYLSAFLKIILPRFPLPFFALPVFFCFNHAFPVNGSSCVYAIGFRRSTMLAYIYNGHSIAYDPIYRVCDYDQQERHPAIYIITYIRLLCIFKGLVFLGRHTRED